MPDPETKLFKDYYAKLSRIEENEKRKMERINFMENKIQKRLMKI